MLADALPVRDAVLVVSGALLTALFAQIAINVPASPVPITGQTLAVGLVGASLGARRGASSLALYALLGLFLPFYADGESGWDVVWGASGGYIIGFIFAAGLIGWMAEHGADRAPGARVPRLRRRPARDLRLRPGRAEDRGRRDVGLDDPQRLLDLHRRRARQGADRRRRAALRVAARATIRAPMMLELLVRLVGNLAALWVASELFDEMTYGDSFWVLLLAAVVFTIVNWIVKPIVAILSIPLIILTLGVAYFFVNVLMLLLTELGGRRTSRPAASGPTSAPRSSSGS